MLTVRSTINISSQTVPPIIPVVQGDTGRAILFTLADFTIPAGATATYYVQKPSGEAVYNNATIDGNNVLVNLTAQSIIEKGDNYGQVRIAVGEDIVTSFDFILLVKEFRGIEAVQSLTEMNIFDKAVEQAADAIDDVKTDALDDMDSAKTAALDDIGDAKDAALQEIEQSTGNFADDFSASATYAAGDYVMHSGQLYRFTANHAAGAWTGSDAEAVTVGEELTDLKAETTDLKDDLNFTTNNLLTDVQKVEKYIGWQPPVASDYYDYFAYVPVSANVTYALNFTARYVQLFNANKAVNGSVLENVASFTPTVDGFAHVTILRTNQSYANPKMYAGEASADDVLDYGEHWLNDKVVAQTISEELKNSITAGLINKESVNAFDGSLSTSGLLQANGTITDATSYKTTDFIDVKAGNSYTIYNLRTFLAFNASKAAVSGSFIDADTYGYVYTPTADGYIRWSYLSTREESQSLKIYAPSNGKKIAEGIELSNLIQKQVLDLIHGNTGNVLAGKKWWACGDSFTEWTTETYTASDASNVTGLTMYKTYPYWIGKRNPSLTVYNYAVSGQTMATPESGDFTNAFSNGLYQNIPSDVDYITLYFGINDSHHRQGSSSGDGEDNTGVIPLGTINDTTVSTFYGAWNVVLEYLITNHPWAKIGIIITNGAETEDYPNAEIALAKKWGIPYLDLNGDYKLPLMLRSNGKTEVCQTAVNIRKSQQWTDPSSNGHPNVNAHKFESTFIENWLRSI